jgi:hypothetical protein
MVWTSSPYWFASFFACLLSGHTDVVEESIVELEQGFARLPTQQCPMGSREDPKQPNRNLFDLRP